MPKVSHVPDRCVRDMCGVPLIPQRSRGVRVVVPPGYRLHAGRGLCDRCHEWARRRPGQLDQFPPLVRDPLPILERWAVLRAAGHTYRSGAPLIGLSADQLRHIVDRARELERAQIRPAKERTHGPVGWSRPQLFDPDTRDEGEHA